MLYMGQQTLKYGKIKSENDFRSFVKQFSVLSILKCTYEISKEVYIKGFSIDSLKRHIIEKDVKNGNIIEQDIIIQPWQFADLIYKSIMYSNDYKGVPNLEESIFFHVLAETNEYVSFKTEELFKNFKSAFDISLFTYGFAGEQFKYQNRFNFFQSLIRELYIIFSLTKKYSSVIKPEEIVRQELGVDWKDLVLVLFVIFIDSFNHQEINKAINCLTFGSNKDKSEIFKKVTEYYSADYYYIRNNNTLGRQIFNVKPFIKTQKQGLLSASVFFNQFILEHAVFWIIRNHFLNKLKKQRQTFSNEFGHLFEYYLEELFVTYKVNYTKIPEGKEKRADWHLTIGKYNILIEQKSAILPISIKQQLTDFKTYKKEVNKIIHKALQQLDRTEKDLKIDKPIKIILCYDNYINAKILPHIFEENNCQVYNDGRYFVANVMEIEMFIEISSKNYSLFETIVKDMLRRNNRTNNETLSLLKIMKEKKYNVNSYWTSPIFDEYKNIFEEFIDENDIFKDKYRE